MDENRNMLWRVARWSSVLPAQVGEPRTAGTKYGGLRAVGGTLGVVLLVLGCFTTREKAPDTPTQEYVRGSAPPAEVIYQREPASQVPPGSGGLHTLEWVSDAELASALRHEFAELRQAGEYWRVNVEAKRGIVTLTGIAPTRALTQVAVERAETIRGVRAVINRLEAAPVVVSDDEIETVIRAMWVEDPAVEEFEIAPRADSGRVVLTGVVQSLAERETAVLLARSVPGVRNVRDEIRVVPRRQRADREIRGDVLARIAHDAHLSGNPVTVAVSDGVVGLTGSVGSAMERRRAQSLARVDGAKAVVNALTVDPAFGDAGQPREQPLPSDIELGNAVRDALRLDPRVPQGAITVAVKDRNVTLSGATPSLQSKRIAGQDAANTVGVWSVKNAIVVRPPKPASDAALMQRIRERLTSHPGLDLQKLAIRAIGGRVILKGEVPNRVQRAALQRLIEETPGVVEVVDEVRVMDALAAVRDDEMLERDIETSLYYDQRVREATVDVEVENGIAIVMGTVPNRAVHDAVMENVWEARPRGVDDRLRPPS